jgi:hypothetical protein
MDHFTTKKGLSPASPFGWVGSTEEFTRASIEPSEAEQVRYGGAKLNEAALMPLGLRRTRSL